MKNKIKVQVYCLINPINDSPFYVGATQSELKHRLSSHIGDRGNMI